MVKQYEKYPLLNENKREVSQKEYQWFDDIQHFIAFVNEKSQFLYLNPRGSELLSFGDLDYRGYLLCDYLVDGSKIWKFLQDHCRDYSGGIKNYPVKIIDAHNKEIPIEISCRLLEGEDTVYMLQTVCPFQPLQSHEKNFEFKLLDKFAESIANELLNPVNIISGRLQLLSADLSRDIGMGKSITILDKQVQRISETVSKLLTFSRLKEDSIPQKIHINEILQRILLDPSIIRYLEKDETHMEFNLDPDLKVLPGIISHFDLLFKTIIDLSFFCLGLRGRVIVKTSKLENFRNKNWVEVVFTLNYSESVFGSKTTLHSYLQSEPGNGHFQSIEKAIVYYIISNYNGIYHLSSEDNTSEKLTLRFPIEDNSEPIWRPK